VVGTDQSRATFAAAIVNGYKSHCPMGPERRARMDTAIDRELRYSVFNTVQRFSSSMVAVGRRQMTKLLTEEDLIRMATAHFDAENLYDAVQWTTTTGTRRSWWGRRAAREEPIGSRVGRSCAS